MNNNNELKFPCGAGGKDPPCRSFLKEVIKMNKEFIQAIEDLEKERQISKDVLIEAIESALVSAYKKNYGTSQNVRVDIDRENGRYCRTDADGRSR